MGNLFSIFDPAANFNAHLNWLSSFIPLTLFLPCMFWVGGNHTSQFTSALSGHLNKEISLLLGKLVSPGHSHILISLFMFIALNNVWGLVPYVFTSSSHLSFTLVFALMIWMIVVSSSVLKDLNSALAHLVPQGTPYALMPLMVLIELVSNFIRPITLSVRLAANMVAGHLLLTLIGGSGSISAVLLTFMVMIGMVLMMALECAVAVIQSYVFSTLSSLYTADVNSLNLNLVYAETKKK